jgi:cell division protein FtsL
LSPARAAAAAASRSRATRATAVPRSRAAAPAEAPRPRRAPSHRPAPRTGTAHAPRARIKLGFLLVPLIALLLAGVVWMNVAKLALTTETGRVVDRARSVEAETVRLKGRLEQQDGAVNARARDQLGMVDPPSQSLVILDVPTQGR